jgi:hypothetical protein
LALLVDPGGRRTSALPAESAQVGNRAVLPEESLRGLGVEAIRAPDDLALIVDVHVIQGGSDEGPCPRLPDEVHPRMAVAVVPGVAGNLAQAINRPRVCPIIRIRGPEVLHDAILP